MRKNKSPDHYFDLNDLNREGNMVFSNGAKPPLSSWARHEPNNRDVQYGEEDCAEYKRYENYAWNDVSCRHRRRYICQVARA